MMHRFHGGEKGKVKGMGLHYGSTGYGTEV